MQVGRERRRDRKRGPSVKQMNINREGGREEASCNMGREENHAK